MNPTTPRANRRAFARYLRTAMTHKYGQRAKATQLARDTGLSDQTISRWLNEGADPTPEKLKQLAPVLGVPLAELLTIAEILPGDNLAATPNLDLAIWAAFINEQLASRSIDHATFVRLLDQPSLTRQIVSDWSTAQAAPSPEAAVRVAQVLGLPATQVLRAAGRDELANYIDDVAGNTASDAAALEPLIARVRALTDGLTDDQRRALEQEFLDQVGNWYLLAETKATRLRRTAEDGDTTRGAS